MHIFVKGLVTHTDMTKEADMLETLIKAVISFFWKKKPKTYSVLPRSQTKHSSKYNECFARQTRQVNTHSSQWLNTSWIKNLRQLNQPKQPLVWAFTLAALFRWYIDGSSAGFPAAHLVALMSSARALATSRTAFISTTWGDTPGINTAQ